MIFIAWLIVLGIIILAAYWYETTPWRYCRLCGAWWNVKTFKSYNYMPTDADGIAKPRDCAACCDIDVKPTDKPTDPRRKELARLLREMRHCARTDPALKHALKRQYQFQRRIKLIDKTLEMVRMEAYLKSNQPTERK